MTLYGNITVFLQCYNETLLNLEKFSVFRSISLLICYETVIKKVLKFFQNSRL